MIAYYFGQKPMKGDIVECLFKDEEYDYIDEVSNVNDDGTININNGLGILYEIDPSNFALIKRKEETYNVHFKIILNGMPRDKFNEKFSEFLKNNGLSIE